MSFKPILAVFCVVAAAAPVWAQAQLKTKPSTLADLIQTGNRKAALDQIRAGADVNAAQPDGTRPVHWAVYQVDYELLDALIAKKAKVDVTNDFGSTPLAEAVKLADARLVKTLLAAGAGPESPNLDGETALMVAIQTGDLSIVDMLIKAGANVNAVEKFHNQTPLMYAADAPKNAGEIVKLLLSKDASVTPRALYTDWPNQISSEPRAQFRPVGGLTALLYAARDGCYDCVEEMIRSGADVNVPTPEGVTPLMIALDNEHNEVAKLLLDQGADPNVWDWWGRTALYVAVDRKEAGGGRGAPGGGGRGGAGRGGRGGGRPGRDSRTGCSGRFQHRYHQHSAGRRCGSQSAAQYASPQPGRQQRTLLGGTVEHGMHASVSGDRAQRHASDSGPSGQRRESQHQRDGLHPVPAGGRG